MIFPIISIIYYDFADFTVNLLQSYTLGRVTIAQALTVSYVRTKDIFIARRYASAVYAVIVSVRPSVCPSVRHKSVFYEDS